MQKHNTVQFSPLTLLWHFRVISGTTNHSNVLPSEYILVLPLPSALFWSKVSAAMCVAKFCREIAAVVGLLLLLKTSPASK